MSRFLWLSLIAAIGISLLWWPAEKNHDVILDLINQERIWQTQYLGFDLVETVDQGLLHIQSLLTHSPIPSGTESTLRHPVGMVDHEIEAAVNRVAQEPYPKAMFALIVLAIGRFLVTCFLALLLSPLIFVVAVDALCAREVRHAKFLPASSLQFRIALALFFVLVEVMCVMCLAPVWINPFFILLGFTAVLVCIHQIFTHYYK